MAKRKKNVISELCDLNIMLAKTVSQMIDYANDQTLGVDFMGGFNILERNIAAAKAECQKIQGGKQ